MLVSGFLVLQLTDSIFQTQLIGVAFFTPMLLGGVLSGVLADSFDRRRLMIGAHIWNITVVAITGTLVLTQRIEPWHVIVLTVAFGVAGTADMSARRTFAFDLVGPGLVATAIALESLTVTGALMMGPIIGGILLDVVPLGGTANAGAAYVTILVLFVVALILLTQMRPVKRDTNPIRLGTVVTSVSEGIRAVSSSRAILSVLGITVLINLTFFPYLPLIPVFAQKVLDVSPTLMGFLGASQGFGALLGAGFLVSRKSMPRKSRYYLGGSLLALLGLFFFSLSTVYPLSVLGLMLAGVGVSGFATMQATLILLSASEETRGRAMGILSMAIGVLPLSMLGLGALAAVIGPGLAVTLATSVGLVATSIWSWRARELRRL